MIAPPAGESDETIGAAPERAGQGARRVPPRATLSSAPGLCFLRRHIRRARPRRTNRGVQLGHDLTRPAVTVHGIFDARRALSFGRPVTLLSAPGAAMTAGCLWWRALIDAATAEAPDTPCDDILDCGDAPGRAMAALRIGQRTIILDPACPAFVAVAGAAATVGASVLRKRPRSLDLARPRAHRGLESWLSPVTDAGH